MIPKYRRKGIICLGMCVALIPICLLLIRAFDDEDHRLRYKTAPAVGIAVGLLYIYGCYLLIKAKGHSSAVLLLMIPFLCILWGAMLVPLAAAIALPDRFPQANARKRRRTWGWMERRRKSD